MQLNDQHEINSYIQCCADKKRFLSDMFKTYTRYKKHKLCFLQHGRSMVEMLGVLAIIGVLSVGAIAGYSKAMMKYKLNNHAQAMNSLLNNILQIKDQLPTSNEQVLYYADLLRKLNLLPDGIVYTSDKIIKDKYFNINMSPLYYTNKVSGFGEIEIYFGEKADHLAEVCRNIMFVAKENAADISDVQTLRSGGTAASVRLKIYGNKSCNGKDKKCLSSITLQDMDTFCLGCVDYTNCKIVITW